MLLFYDFEVFKYDWLVVIIDPVKNERNVIVNDAKKLKTFYELHKEDIWVGFNSRGYDQHILKGILSGFNPYKISQWIIEKGRKGNDFNSAMNKIQLYNYDVSKGKTDYSLKTLEAFMGNNIKETSVPFNINRKLTIDELAETIKYCTHDVEQTIEVFLERRPEFDSQIDLIKTFNLPMNNIGKTQAQLAAIILGAKRKKFDDEFNIRVPDNAILNKYKCVTDWFLNSYESCIGELDEEYQAAKEGLKAGVGSKKKLNDFRKLILNYESNYEKTFASFFYNRSLTIDIAGVEHNIAMGGIHGAKRKYYYKCKPDELLIMADVDQLYPTLMVVYKLLSRAVTKPELFEEILATSLRLKAEKKKKEREPYKRICNITYGSEGDEFNDMYDPLHRTLVCLYGQVFIVDLIEKLEVIPSFELIQSNTDGILIKIKRQDFEQLDDIVYEWEARTGLHMSFDYYKSVFQKDVNNYVAIDINDNFKSKGAYVKSLSRLDNDLPIVNKAMVEYMINDTPVEATINNCDELIMFQKIAKLSSKFDFVQHNNVRYDWKSYRVFASKNMNDGMIYKCKHDGKQDKFANTPEHCFIYNDDINGAAVPSNLDKKYYIDLAYDRLNQFGVI